MNHLSKAVLSRALLIVAFVLFSVAEAFSQKVIIDKTTDTYRKIITSETDWYELGQYHKASLCYFCFKDSISFYILDINWDIVDRGVSTEVEEGYKLFFKQQSGNITELVCLGDKLDMKKETSFIRILGFLPPDIVIKTHTLYYLTESQAESLLKDPVIKMRIEFRDQYYDLDRLRKNGTFPFSDYFSKAYNTIKKARETTKTGPYDNF